MISALLATLGILIAVVLVVVGAAYGFARIILAIIGGAAGAVSNAFKKVKR